MGIGENKARITVFIFTTASSARLQAVRFLWEEVWASNTLCFWRKLEFMYLCEVYLCFDLPTLWGNTLCQDYVPPIFIFLCWKRPDSHLNTYTVLLHLSVWSVGKVGEKQTTHLQRFFGYFRILVNLYAGVALQTWERHGAVKNSELDGEVLRTGLMQWAGSEPSPMKNNII